MQKFQDLPYVRPQIDQIDAEFKQLLEKLSLADSAQAQIEVIKDINNIRNHFMTMASLCSVRHTIDTTDAYYEAEQEYMDEITPLFEGLNSEFYEILLNSRYRAELENTWGKQFFNLAELQAKTFKPEIIEDLQLENKLTSQYTKLRATAKIQFDGKELNLSQMTPYAQSPDRDVRRAAQSAISGFYAAHEAEFDDIYDKLVKVRDTIAKKLGFENYVAVAYAKLSRSDYDHQMVAGYRKQVFDHLVPLTQKMRAEQKERLQLDALKFYDEDIKFLSGNAKPKGSPEEIVAAGRQMYQEMSPETHAFFEMMLESGLMDLESKAGKAGGGYCTYFNDYKMPFIFSNFNGTSGDVDVLTHEAGHAFQVYSSGHFDMPEYYWPTMESAEIHSMSMEFFAWPWMDLFFKEETDKYKFSHIASAILFIPYGVTVDEFQHWVYENPTATPEQRKAQWRKIEAKYLPHRDYDGDAFLENGGFWFRQLHIFQSPFYYIDYTLAQVCALEFWSKSRTDRATAWQDYLRLCQAGGSQSFLGLVSLAGLHNPFKDGTLAHIVTPVAEWLNSVDASQY